MALLVFGSRAIAPERHCCPILHPEAAPLPVLPCYLPGEESRALGALVPALALRLPVETRSEQPPFLSANPPSGGAFFCNDILR